jgi:hypothetical protein
MTQPVQGEVSLFWAWFEKHREQLAAVEVDPELVEALDARVCRMGNFDWEIGPGRKQACFFALSPAGEVKALAHTRRVIEQAPELPGWELYPAKPPRQWSLVFELDRNGRDVSIDGGDWEVVVYRFKDGTFDVVLKPPDESDLSDEEADWAARVIVDGELGEAVALELVGAIETVRQWGAKAAAAARKLELGLLSSVVGAERH